MDTTNYEREPIFWLVKLLQARERRDGAAEREAQRRLKLLGVTIRFAAAGKKAVRNG